MNACRCIPKERHIAPLTINEAVKEADTAFRMTGLTPVKLAERVAELEKEIRLMAEEAAGASL